jgi:hypothetical protein
MAQIGDEMMLPIDETTKLITYQEVVTEEGSKNDLFNRSIGFLNEFYKNPVAVTKVRDPHSGVVRGQHQFRVHYTDEEGYRKEGAMVMYDFRIELKDGRYRYTLTDFLVKKVSRYPVENWLNKNDPEYSKKWDEFLVQINDYVTKEWVPTLKKNMKPLEVIEEEEW